MNALVDRRSLLTAALAVPALAVPVAAVAETETPVMRLFREWSRLTALIEGGDRNDCFIDDCTDQRGDLEIQLARTKAETPIDALMKVCAITDFGFYGNGDHALPEAWTEARALIAA